MSIVLVGVQRDVTLVVTDTAAVSPDGPRSIAKSFPLPHIDAVLVGHGVGRVVALLAAEAAVSGMDFDGIAAWLPDALTAHAEPLGDDMSLVPERDRKIELILTGWSPQRSSFIAHAVQRAADGAIAIDVYEPDGIGGHVIAAPWDQCLGALPTLADLDGTGFVDVARRQVELMNAGWAPGSAGGDLIVSVLTMDGITARRIVLDWFNDLSAAA